MLQQTQARTEVRAPDWRRFVMLFLGTFVGGIVAAALFILLLDPFDMVPFSLPIERPLVSGSQRFAYPQAMRSKRFDSIIVGSSTARLIDPEQLNGPFNARFANMAMNASSAWEQWRTFEYFRRNAGAPKVLIIGIDDGWCDPNADRDRMRHGFPEWMYDDDKWNDYANLFNSGTLEIAARLVGYHLGLYRARSRYDGFEVFTPPESDYVLERARAGIWMGQAPRPLPDVPPPTLSDRGERRAEIPCAGLDEYDARRTAGVQHEGARLHAGPCRGAGVGRARARPRLKRNARRGSRRSAARTAPR